MFYWGKNNRTFCYGNFRERCYIKNKIGIIVINIIFITIIFKLKKSDIYSTKSNITTDVAHTCVKNISLISTVNFTLMLVLLELGLIRFLERWTCPNRTIYFSCGRRF